MFVIYLPSTSNVSWCFPENMSSSRLLGTVHRVRRVVVTSRPRMLRWTTSNGATDVHLLRPFIRKLKWSVAYEQLAFTTCR